MTTALEAELGGVATLDQVAGRAWAAAERLVFENAGVAAAMAWGPAAESSSGHVASFFGLDIVEMR